MGRGYAFFCPHAKRQKSNEHRGQRDPKVFEVLGILIAVRDEGKKPVVDSCGHVVLLKSYFESAAKVLEFLQGTGLAEIFQSRRIKNLVDYVFGIETPSDGFITFEDHRMVDASNFIDGRIRSTKVLIEQKSLGKDLRAGIRQSDGSLLNPFQQAKR